MTDNLTARANTGDGTDLLATKEIGGVHYPKTIIYDSSGSEVVPATAAAQATGNTSLANLDLDLGAQADAAATTDTGTFSLIALIKRGLQNWTTLLGRVPANGQAAMTASIPVVIASNQSAVTVSLPGMAASSYSQAGVIAINTDLLVVDCQGLRGVSIHCTSMGTTGVVTPAWSNDGTTYVNATILTQAGATATTFNAAGLWTSPTLGRYLRLRLTTATTGGTTTIVVQGIPQSTNLPVPAQPISGTVSISGAPTLGAGTALAADFGMQYRANATGAASINQVVAAASTNPTVVKASAGRLLGFVLTNNATAVRYVKFHNQTTSPTAGTGVVQSYGIPPNGGTVAISIPGGVAFSTGIALTTVTGAATTDATAVAVNDIVGTIHYA